MAEDKQVFDFERQGNVLVVIPTGSLIEFRDSDIRNAYNDTYRYLDDSEVKHLLIDFSKLDYFGSTFIGMLIRLAKKARQGGGEAVLCHLSDNMKQMMKTLMLLENTKTDFFWVPFESREAALASLNDRDAKNCAGSAASADTSPKKSADADSSDGPPDSDAGGWARFVKK